MSSTVLTRISKLLLSSSSYNNHGDDAQQRVIEFDDVNSSLGGKKFPSNVIKTTKYTVLKFVPLFLKEQFSNFTNWFFLAVICIQQIPGVSPVGKYTTLFPFTAVLTVSALKELNEDYRRYNRSKEVNYRDALVLVKDEQQQQATTTTTTTTSGNNINYRFVEKKWQHLRVGDIVKISANENVPADVLQLRSSREDGVSYIETSNLDGETNLKARQSLPELQKICMPEGRSRYDGAKITCDPPNEMIYSFHGHLTLLSSEHQQSQQQQQLVVGNNQLLLRGCVLKNTDWIVGVIVYTGHDTKIMKNTRPTPSKHSTLLKTLNQQIMIFVVILVVLIVVCSFGGIWWSSSGGDVWYLNRDGERFWINLLTFSILFSFIVPISLQVIQEMVRNFQAYFINNDRQMYTEKSDVWPDVRTSSLNEDLGRVAYIFSDKTGTLTSNVLQFKRCIVNATVFEEKTFPELVRRLKYPDDGSGGEVYHHFLRCICLCNNVQPYLDRDTGRVTYYAASPDESVLLNALATEFDYRLIARQRNVATISVTGGRQYTYNVLAYNEFTSQRKCSSILVEDQQQGNVYLYIMGSDDVIIGKVVTAAKDSKTREENDRTWKMVHDLAVVGFRTLCMGMVKVDAKPKVVEWTERYRSIQQMANQNEQREKFSRLADQMERDVRLLGATCVEDKLQDEVPETISVLLEAGISVWMLTGDKLETALNIGYSVHFLSRDTPTVIVDGEDSIKLRALVRQSASKLGRNLGTSGNNMALVVSGASLYSIFNSDFERDFMMFALSCRSVICCRCSPLQKSQIVAYVQNNTDTVTLAIGDGANDIAMIQEATIGIGITGMEGFQAAQAADYSIGQFKHLKRLLLIHGSWSYYRICSLIMFCFYKNFLLVISSLYYTVLNGWSGQIMFDEWALISFNIFFTSAHLVVFGTFDKNFHEQTLLANPSLYALNDWFTTRWFTIVLLNGVFHGILCTYLCLSALRHEVFWSHGYGGNYMIDGNTLYTVIIAVTCIKFLFHSQVYTWFTAISVIVSYFSWMLLLVVLSFIYPLVEVGQNMVNIFVWMVTSPFILIAIAVIVFATILIDWFVIAVYRTIHKPISVSKRKLTTRRKFATNYGHPKRE